MSKAIDLWTSNGENPNLNTLIKTEQISYVAVPHELLKHVSL